MPSAGTRSFAGARAALSTHPYSRPPASGLPRLTHATRAFTRLSACPTYVTPPAPYEWPTTPTFFAFSRLQNGLYAASKPALTRSFWYAAWLVPLSQDFTGTYG